MKEKLIKLHERVMKEGKKDMFFIWTPSGDGISWGEANEDKIGFYVDPNRSSNSKLVVYPKGSIGYDADMLENNLKKKNIKYKRVVE